MGLISRQAGTLEKQDKFNMILIVDTVLHIIKPGNSRGLEALITNTQP